MKKAKKGEAVMTETLTVRLTPRLKYGLELLARKQHRTLAGVVAWAVEQAVNSPDGIDLDKLYHPIQEERIRLLEKHAVSLLHFEEWQLIQKGEV